MQDISMNTSVLSQDLAIYDNVQGEGTWLVVVDILPQAYKYYYFNIGRRSTGCCLFFFSWECRLRRFPLFWRWPLRRQLAKTLLLIL